MSTVARAYIPQINLRYKVVMQSLFWSDIYYSKINNDTIVRVYMFI